MAAKPDLKAEGKVLAKVLADARKGPIAFAMLEGADGLVVVADKVKSVAAMRGAAKALGGGRGGWGMMRFDGRILTLECEGETPGNLQKKAQQHFSERGHVLRVSLGVGGEGEAEDAKKEPPPPADAERATGAPVEPEDSAEAPPEDTAEDDDADDLAAQAGDLKALIAATRKKPYNFACLLADGGVVLQAHRRRPAELLIKKARAEGGGPRGGFGTMRTEGKCVVLTCLEDPPRPLARGLKLHLRDRGFFLGVKLMSAGGEVLIEEAEGDGDAVAQAAPPAPPTEKGGAPVPEGGLPLPDPVAVAVAFDALLAEFMRRPGGPASPAGKKLAGMAKVMEATVAAGDGAKAQKLLDLARVQAASFGAPASAQTAGGSSAAPPPATATVTPQAPLPPGPGAPLVWVNGPATGKKIAEFWTQPVNAGQRIERGYASGDEATAIARSLSGTAAVLIENAEYAVYKTSGTTGFFGGENTDIDSVTLGNSDQTKYIPLVGNIFVLITGDKYVVRISGNVGTVDRDGADANPLDSHMKAFGPGLSGITDRDKFEAQMELAMRDLAQSAVNNAEAAAREAQARFSKPMTPEDQARLTATLDKMAPIDKAISEKSAALKLAQAALAVKMTTQMMNPFSVPSAMLDTLGTGTFVPPWQAEMDAVNKLDAEIAALQAERSAAAVDFPLALRLDDPDDFRKLSPEEQSKRLKEEADGVLEDVLETRENIDDGDFDFWTMPGIRNTAMAGLGLKDPQLGWAKDKADWEGTKDTIWGVGEAVVGIGLAVGAAFATGGTALLLGGAALGVGVGSAVGQTEEYFRKGSAANIALDPSQGLIPPEDVPHWGWVAAAWVGVGLDAAAVGKAVKVMKETNDLRKAAQILGVAEDQIDTLLRPALTGKGTSSFKATLAGEEAFNSQFGQSTAEAVTVISRNPKGGFDVEVVVRAGSDPATRAAAVAEEMRHIAQLSDPKFADDVALLTEEALQNWAKAAPEDKLKTLRAQLRLEEDARHTAVAALRDKLAKATGAERSVIEAELDEALAGADDFARKLAEVEDGLATGKVPAWADLASPPRLFNTPKQSAVTKQALQDLPGLKEAWDAVDNADDLYYFAKQGDGYIVKQRPGAGVDSLQLVKSGEKWELVKGGRKSTATAREEVEAIFGDKRGTLAMEAGMEGFTSPYQKAYARKYARAFEGLETEGIKPEKLLEGLGELSDSAFESALRNRLRDVMVQGIKGAPGPEKAAKLKRYMDLMPDNASRGALFSDFRKADMGKGLVDKPPGTNATKLAGENRSGDGLVEVAEGAVKPGPKAVGPKPGNYLAEDKNGAAAFKASQLDTYNEALKSPDGLKMADGSVLDGVTYYFPDFESASGALTLLRKGGYSPKIHVGYYENGKLVWGR